MTLVRIYKRTNFVQSNKHRVSLQFFDSNRNIYSGTALFIRDLQEFVFKSIVFIHFITFIFTLFSPLGIYWGFRYCDILGFRISIRISILRIFILENSYFLGQLNG